MDVNVINNFFILEDMILSVLFIFLGLEIGPKLIKLC